MPPLEARETDHVEIWGGGDEGGEERERGRSG